MNKFVPTFLKNPSTTTNDLEGHKAQIEQIFHVQQRSIPVHHLGEINGH